VYSTYAKRSALVLLLGIALPILCTQVRAEDPAPYSALLTLQKAQVGTFSPRLAPPVKVAPSPLGTTTPDPRRYERKACRIDVSRPLDRILVCTSPKFEKSPISG
jgi:hypothetical protein